jgi:predicted phage-related endonuclease
MAILVFQRGIYVIEVERDDEFIESLREAERLFWENNIVKDRMPDPDGSDASIATLKELYPEAAPKTEIAIPGLDVFVADYKAYTALAKQYQQQADEAKAKICAKMGDNEIAVGDKYRCTWRNQSKTGVPAKKLKEKYPAIYSELAEVSSYRTFRVGNL